MSRLLLALLIQLMTACANVPAPLSGRDFAPLTPLAAQSGAGSGQRIRWGGEIVSTKPGAKETCLEIVSRPLSDNARPENTDRTDGRFIACGAGFYDPAVYAENREVTVTGTVERVVAQKIGEYEYRFPRVKAETIYLWPKRVYYPTYAPYYRDPFWYYPWGPWPYYRYPYWW